VKRASGDTCPAGRTQNTGLRARGQELYPQTGRLHCKIPGRALVSFVFSNILMMISMNATLFNSACKSVKIRKNGKNVLQKNDRLIVTQESYLKYRFYLRYHVVPRRVEYREKKHPAPFESC
jgi:hypothetical protein